MNRLGDSRSEWLTLADALVAPAAQRISDGVVRLPGATSAHGVQADGMEAFCRTFLIHALRVAAEPGSAPVVVTTAFTDGLEAAMSGTPDKRRWPVPGRKGHATVEATSLAVALHVSRAATWDRLTPGTQDALARWMADAATAVVPENNWLLFPPTIAGFLRSVGYDNLVRDVGTMHDAWDRVLEFPHGPGWISDGRKGTYDYYTSWALVYYPALSAFLHGDDALRGSVAPVLRHHVQELTRLFDRDGAPVLFGRSMTYRFGMLAALGAGALIDALPFPASHARAFCGRTIDFFASKHVQDEDGIVGVGLWSRSDALRQDYSGPGASYWLGKALIPLLLDPADAFWRGSAVALRWRPESVVLSSEGLLVAPTTDGSAVRVFNHGSSGRIESLSKGRADDPWYSRLTYSSRTAPVRSAEGLAGAVSFEERGALTSRGAVEKLASGAAWAASRAAHRIPLGFGSYSDLVSTRANSVEFTRQKVHNVSVVVAGDWVIEVACVPRGENLRGPARWAGCALPASVDATVDRDAEGRPWGAVTDASLCSAIVGLIGFDDAIIARPTDEDPLGTGTAMPILRGDKRADPDELRWFACATFLGTVMRDDRQIVAASPVLVGTDRRRVEIWVPGGESVTITFDGRFDVSRREMLVRPTTI